MRTRTFHLGELIFLAVVLGCVAYSKAAFLHQFFFFMIVACGGVMGWLEHKGTVPHTPRPVNVVAIVARHVLRVSHVSDEGRNGTEQPDGDEPEAEGVASVAEPDPPLRRISALQ